MSDVSDAVPDLSVPALRKNTLRPAPRDRYFGRRDVTWCLRFF